MGGGSHLSTEVQSVYSTASADWTKKKKKKKKRLERCPESTQFNIQILDFRSS